MTILLLEDVDEDVVEVKDVVKQMMRNEKKY